MIKLKILDTEWRFYVYEHEQYEAKFGADSAALVIPSDNEGHFNLEDLTLSTVKHELFHAWLAALPINSARISKNQMEEICCDLFSDYGDLINRQARKLYKELKRELE